MKQYVAMPIINENNSFHFSKENRDFISPKNDEVMVHVKFAGICGSDIARYMGKAYHYPIVIGHEFSGVVESEGEFKGKRVTVFPIIPCHECEACKKGKYAMCKNYNYYGSRCDGAFQEYLNVKKENLILIPDNVSLEAAAMTEPCAVALHGIKKLGSLEGKEICIFGAGTIGLLLVKLAIALGAKRVFISDVDKKKLEYATKCGAIELKEDDNSDYFIDACGVPVVLSNILKRVKAESKVLLLGNPSDDVFLKKEDYWQILRKEVTLFGTWNSTHYIESDWKDVLKMQEEGKLKIEDLITHKFNLCDAEQAMYVLKDHKEFAIKVMLNTNE